MTKKFAMKSLKTLVFAGAITLGATFLGGQVEAAENVDNTQVVTTQTVQTTAVNDTTSISDKATDTNSAVKTTSTSTTTTVDENKDTAQKTNSTVEATTTGAKDTAVDTTSTSTTTTTEVKNTAVNTTTNTPVQKSTSSFSLLNLELGGSLLEPLLGKVDVDVLEIKNPKEESGPQGLVQIDIKDSKLLGDVHAGVLETNKTGESTSNALITADVKSDALKGIVDDVHLGVAESKNTATSQYGSLLNTDVSSGLLGDVHAGALEGYTITTADGYTKYNSLLNADISDKLLGSVLGDVHVGVAESSSGEDKDSTWKNGSLITIGTKDNPILGDVTVKLPDFSQVVTKDPGTTNPGTTNPGTTNPGGGYNVSDVPWDVEPTSPNEQNKDVVVADKPVISTISEIPVPLADDNEVTAPKADNLVAAAETPKTIGQSSIVNDAVDGGKALPTTGSLFNSTMLLLMALALMTTGSAMRKFN